MKLLYIHDTPLDSKVANIIQVVQMCNAFANNGLEVELAVPQSKKGNRLSYYSDIINSIIDNEIRFSLILYRKITIFGRLKHIGGYLGVRNLLKQTTADICFTRNVSYVGLALKTQLQVIYEAHGPFLHIGGLGIQNFLWMRHFLRMTKKNNFIKLIVISNALAQFWKSEGVASGKIVALHDGVNSDNYEKIESQQIARNKIGLKNNRKIILYSGSLYKDRGIERILRLADHFKNCLFIVIGGPKNEKNYYEIFACKKSITNIIFKGHLSHQKIPDYLFAADILLLLRTKKEKHVNYCSPLKMFEYMAAERIIVGDGFTTVKEVLEDGKTALLADPDSFEELKNKIKIAIENSGTKNIAKKARYLALDKYTWDKRAKTIKTHIDTQIERFCNK